MLTKRDEPAAGERKRGKDGRFRPRQAVVRKKATEPQETEEEEKPLRPSQCRGYLRRELAHSFRGIVNGFVKQAKSGSVQHLKMTTELLAEPPGKMRPKGSAELLVERLRRVGERKASELKPTADEDVWRE